MFLWHMYIRRGMMSVNVVLILMSMVLQANKHGLRMTVYNINKDKVERSETSLILCVYGRNGTFADIVHLLATIKTK